MSTENVRLSKLMSERGLCSRREADRYIEKGQVEVDGKVISVLGTKVSPNSKINLLGRARKQQNSKVTVIMNKPLGYVSNMPEKGYKEAIELITPENQYQPGKKELPKYFETKLAVVGRLDINSKGLLVLTEDGRLAKKLIGPDSVVEKEYLVRVEGTYTDEQLDMLRLGLFLDEKPLKPIKLKVLEEGLFKMILVEGRKRQIRRMCELVGLKPISLKRVRIGKVRLSELPEGKWAFVPSDAF